MAVLLEQLSAYWILIGVSFTIGAFFIILIKYLGKKVNYKLFGFTISDIFSDASNNEKDSNLIDNLPEFKIKRIKRKYFKNYNHTIVLQYGSTIRNPSLVNNDIDFIVLLVGYPTEAEAKTIHNGNIPVQGSSKNFDVVFRDYNSFMCALVTGMPYEHSIIQWNEVRHGNKAYIQWLKQLARNVLISRSHLLKELESRKNDLISTFKDQILKEYKKKEEKLYILCRTGYFLICFKLQLFHIAKMDKKLRSEAVAELGIVENLLTTEIPEDFRIRFNLIVSYLKRKSIPIIEEQLITEINELLNYELNG